MDEFHYYADPDRGWAWQVPMLELPRAQFLLMSATLGDVTRFQTDLTRRTGRPTAVVSSAERPVPLHYEYVTTTLLETIEERLATHQAPIYVVHGSRAAAIEQAQALNSLRVCTREEKDQIAELIGNFRFSAGFGKTLSRLVRNGIGVHHAGMLPKYRRLVELLAQAGLLKIICGTDTLGVGINVPIRTVLLTSLSKYDGIRPRLLTAREFHQIGGRAGRAGFDAAGTVTVQAPDHVVANQKALAKAGDDPKKRRKVVRKKPPEGTIGYGEPTYERLIHAEPEPLQSSFRVSHSMLLNVINRPGDCYTAMRHLLTENDEPPARRRTHIHRALAIYRGLLSSEVVEQLPEPDALGRTARLTVDLQPEFALNQPLSPFALAAVDLLDRDSETYALDLVSVIESTLEDPRPVLSAQRSKARGEAVAAMKADGIEYEERMVLLEDVTYPRPLAELLAGGVRGVREVPPVGAGPRAGAEVGGPGAGRTLDDLHRVRQLLPAGAGGGHRAALSRRRVQGAAPDRAGGRPHRRGDRPDRVAGRARPPGRLQPARGVGAAAQPRGAGARRDRRRPGRPDAAGHGEPAGLPGAGPQRAVPPRRAGRAPELVRAGRAGLRRPGGRPRSGRTPSSPTSPSTPACRPEPRRGVRRC